MKTFKFSLVLRTRENTDVFITLDDNIYGIHSKRVNILYISHYHASHRDMSLRGLIRHHDVRLFCLVLSLQAYRSLRISRMRNMRKKTNIICNKETSTDINYFAYLP